MEIAEKLLYFKVEKSIDAIIDEKIIITDEKGNILNMHKEIEKQAKNISEYALVTVKDHDPVYEPVTPGTKVRISPKVIDMNKRFSTKCVDIKSEYTVVKSYDGGFVGNLN